MSKRDEQIARMKGLMTYGISSTSKKTPITESLEGPDGNIYAIIREGTKFYIKSTPKGSELVAESFDYIGGFMNKKSNEFSSYNQASKNLELKVRSLNEAYGVNKTVELLNPEKKESLMVEMTDSMKASLARYRQIMNNTAGIMNESSTISASNTGNPEAPKTTGFSPKLGEPFTDTAEAKLDSDLKATANNPEKQSEPFGDNSKAEEYKDAQYVPDGSVANKKPSGGKVVRVNEECDYEETIEECEEWGSCGVPETGSVGEVGDDAPFTQSVNTISEDVDSFVGFADEDSMSEGEDSEDFDLDDIDLDLDSDDMGDTEIDDIDTEETLDDEGELEDSELDNVESEEDEEEDEISALRNEIEELRTMVQDLMGDEEMETPEDVDTEDMDDGIEFDDEDETMIDSDDYESMEESRKYIQQLVESAVQLPFPVKVRTDELSDRRGRYGIGAVLSDMLSQRGGSENDKKIIGYIKGKLYEILQCDYELRACMKNNHLSDDDWFEIITTMESNTGQIQKLVNKISFLEPNERNMIDRRVDKLQFFVDKYSKYYDENINPDAQVDDEVEEDLPDTQDVDADNIGFEDDVRMSDNEMDNAAWDSADDEIEFDANDMDDMFDSVTPRRLNEEGTKLNTFGKHPGYRKKPMSLPQTGTDKTESTNDWNDESVYSEQPFGEKIGDSAPYEQLVKETVNSILESIKKKL